MHATYSFKKNNAIEIIYKTAFKWLNFQATKYNQIL